MGCGQMSKIIWAPQPGPQQALLSCPAFEVMFGGARGGGKTDACLGEWAIHADIYRQHAKGVFFRHTLPQLEAAIARSQELYSPLGARWLDQAKTWRFPNRAVLKFRFLERESHAENYQGHDYTRLYFEELTNWASPKPIFRVVATLRSGTGVPCRMRATANPGGPGHHWVKSRHIDPAPSGYVPIVDPETGQTRVFIPSRISDNKILMANDPTYIDRLRGTGSAELVKAWVDGDWSVIEGSYFSEFSTIRHVIKPFNIPAHWPRYRSFDWGHSAPFCVLWFAVSDGTVQPYPRGSLIVYREWYGSSGPNVGLRIPNEQIAKGILERESRGERIEFGKADPAIFAEQGGPSIAEQFRVNGVLWQRADNARIAGWSEVRTRLSGTNASEGKPLLYIFNTCSHLVRTLPALQFDSINVEDVDTNGEDHAADTLRYGLMARQLPRDESIIKTAQPGTFDWLIQYGQGDRAHSQYRRG